MKNQFHASLHLFSRCRIWLKATGNRNLLNLDLSNIHEQAFICSIHFDNNQFKDEKRNELLAIAVPSIHLPVQIPVDKLDEYFARFTSGVYLKFELFEHLENYFLSLTHTALM